MKIYDEKIQKHLLYGGKIKRELETYEVVLHIDENRFFLDDDGDIFNITITDLMYNDWEIVEPEYDWDRIIKDKILCEFWDEIEDKENPCVGCLSKKTVEGFYRNGWDCFWKCCRPFNPNDFNVAKNIKDYEK